MKERKKLKKTKEKLPVSQKLRIPYQRLLFTASLVAYCFILNTSQVLASDMWTQAESIMKDVHNKILGISTIAAIVTASTALLLMNFHHMGSPKRPEFRLSLHYPILQ